VLGNEFNLFHLCSDAIDSIQLQVALDELLDGGVGSHHFLNLSTQQKQS
jgi:hypothetical protein